MIISLKATHSLESMIHNRGTLSGHSCKTPPKCSASNDQRRSARHTYGVLTETSLIPKNHTRGIVQLSYNAPETFP